MKSITLHAAALDNAGVRQEAGKVLTVGKSKNHIDTERAEALVLSGGAVKAK